MSATEQELKNSAAIVASFGIISSRQLQEEVFKAYQQELQQLKNSFQSEKLTTDYVSDLCILLNEKSKDINDLLDELSLHIQKYLLMIHEAEPGLRDDLQGELSELNKGFTDAPWEKLGKESAEVISSALKVYQNQHDKSAKLSSHQGSVFNSESQQEQGPSMPTNDTGPKNKG